MADAPEPSRLLGLPAELRLRIYEQLANDVAKNIIKQIADMSQVKPAKAHQAFLMGIYANKQLRNEFREVWARFMPCVYSIKTPPGRHDWPGTTYGRKLYTTQIFGLHAWSFTPQAVFPADWKQPSQVRSLQLFLQCPDVEYFRINSEGMRMVGFASDMIRRIGSLSQLEHLDITYRVMHRKGFGFSDEIRSWWQGNGDQQRFPRSIVERWLKAVPALRTMNLKIEYLGHWVQFRLERKPLKDREVWQVTDEEVFDPRGTLRAVIELANLIYVILEQKLRMWCLRMDVTGWMHYWMAILGGLALCFLHYRLTHWRWDQPNLWFPIQSTTDFFWCAPYIVLFLLAGLFFMRVHG